MSDAKEFPYSHYRYTVEIECPADQVQSSCNEAVAAFIEKGFADQGKKVHVVATCTYALGRKIPSWDGWEKKDG